ncbi:LiaF transmembrane domain-containing protein [Caldalkalibacillus salinus]|uniref:LiaF transmembrane domain-containing protein n=1 Tax=Caldalkalibacillus salinus TaxID=2803787 RepID=UPI0019235C00|nr:hypothetical protein [Caldalkalibacillus salinus]
MSNYRVGTTSAGILFVCLGLGLLLQLFFDFSVVSQLLNWWPLLLILIGGEILWGVKRTKSSEASHENGKIRYDILSIFIVILFSFATLFLYAFQESGVVTFAHQTLASQSYSIQSTPVEQDIPDQVEEVMIVGSEVAALQLETTDSDRMLIHSNWRNIFAESETQARALIENTIQTSIEGQTMYITLNNVQNKLFFHPPARGQISIAIPHHLSVNGDMVNSDTTIKVDAIQQDWHIKSRSISARVNNQEDVNVHANAFHGHIHENETFWSDINEQQTRAIRQLPEASNTLYLETNSGSITAEVFDR